MVFFNVKLQVGSGLKISRTVVIVLTTCCNPKGRTTSSLLHCKFMGFV